MTTLRPHAGTGRVTLPVPERVQDLRELMSRPADPQLPGMPIQPFPERRSSVGQVALVAVPTVAVLVGSALAVGSATRGAEPAPAPSPSSVTARSFALPEPSAAGLVRHELLLTAPSGPGTPVVLTRSAAGSRAASVLDRYAYSARAGAAPASGGATVLAGSRSTAPAATATTATTESSGTTARRWQGGWSGSWHHGTDPPEQGGWYADPALGKGAGSTSYSS